MSSAFFSLKDSSSLIRSSLECRPKKKQTTPTRIMTNMVRILCPICDTYVNRTIRPVHLQYPIRFQRYRRSYTLLHLKLTAEQQIPILSISYQINFKEETQYRAYKYESYQENQSYDNSYPESTKNSMFLYEGIGKSI